MYKESIAKMRADLITRIDKIYEAYNALDDRESRYAQEHRYLHTVLQDVVDLLDKAPKKVQTDAEIRESKVKLLGESAVALMERLGEHCG